MSNESKQIASLVCLMARMVVRGVIDAKSVDEEIVNTLEVLGTLGIMTIAFDWVQYGLRTTLRQTT